MTAAFDEIGYTGCVLEQDILPAPGDGDLAVQQRRTREYLRRHGL